MDELCRCSYLIMGILRAKNSIDRIHGLTINEIRELEKQSTYNTLYKKIKIMQALGLVNVGIKSGKAKTYYLTENGIKELPEKIKKGNEINDESEKQ